MLKCFPALVVLAGVAPGAAVAQQALFSNASGSPSVPALGQSAVTANGVPAPSSGAWSEVQAPSAMEGNALAGIACQSDSSGGVRVADNFTVPAGESWSLGQTHLYIYDPDATGVGSPVVGATLRIWYGEPGAGGQIVWGDAVTDRLTSATATNIYRVFNTEVGPTIAGPDATRRVFDVVLDSQTTLVPGDYWLDWQLTPTTPGAWLFAVPATLANVRTLAAWNALQFQEGAWHRVLDSGKPATAVDVPLDIAFMISGVPGTACDSIDFNGDSILPDTEDIADFLAVFAGGMCPTGACGDIDFNNDSLFPDTQDIASFLSVFAGGPCV